MAKKNITFRIDESLIEKLNELRGNLSQNAFLEQLITSTSTSTSKEIEEDKVQVQLQVQAEMLKQLQVQVQLLVDQKPQVLVKPQVNVSVMEVEDEDDDDTPAFASSSEDIPEWQKRELTPQDFYGKVPEPYTPGPYDHDPQRYLDEMLEEEKAKTEIKPKKPEIDDYVNPFL